MLLEFDNVGNYNDNKRFSIPQGLLRMRAPGIVYLQGLSKLFVQLSFSEVYCMPEAQPLRVDSSQMPHRIHA